MASEGKRSSRARNDYGPVKLDDKFWLSVIILCIEIILEILLTDLKIPKREIAIFAFSLRIILSSFLHVINPCTSTSVRLADGLNLVLVVL